VSRGAAAAPPPLGFCTLSALDRDLGSVARTAAACGLDGLEVTARPPHLAPDAGPEAARQAGRRVREEGLRVLCHGSYLGSGGRADPAAAAAEVERAAALGAPLLRVWAEPLAGRPDDREPVVTLLRAAADAAAAAGIEVVVERHAGSFADGAERALRLLDAVDRPNLWLNLQPLDGLPVEEADAQPADAARLAPRSRYAHLKNYLPPAEAGGGLRLGASLAAGALDLRAWLAAAAAAGLRGPVSIEFLAFDARPLEERLAEAASFAREALAAAFAAPADGER